MINIYLLTMPRRCRSFAGNPGVSGTSSEVDKWRENILFGCRLVAKIMIEKEPENKREAHCAAANDCEPLVNCDQLGTSQRVQQQQQQQQLTVLFVTVHIHVSSCVCVSGRSHNWQQSLTAEKLPR